MTWNRCSDLPPIDLYLTMTHSSTFSEFREAQFCVTVFSAENTQSDLKLAASTTKTIMARWDRIGNRPLCASQYGLVNWSASGRTSLQFTIYFLYWWMRELICDFWPSKLSHYPSRPGTRPVRPWLLPKIADEHWNARFAATSVRRLSQNPAKSCKWDDIVSRTSCWLFWVPHSMPLIIISNTK